MKKKPFIQEINELNAAVNEFTDELKERLAEKAAEGKRGWDGKGTPQLLAELGKKTAIADLSDALDIAALAMFIHKAMKEDR